MIINTGMRTDIPAFYAEWFANRLKEGYVHGKLDVPKIKSQRGECACLLGKDIGQYDTCGHLCKYCYANSNADAVKRNRKMHNPQSPFLVGELREEDQVHEAKQESWLDNQIRLF